MLDLEGGACTARRMTHEGVIPREPAALPPLTPDHLSQNPLRRASAGEAPTVFHAHDANKRGVLDYRAAFAGLGQLGVANGQETVKAVSELLGMNSPSQLKNHLFTLPEFLACYNMLSRAPEMPSPLDQAVLFRASRASLNPGGPGAPYDKILRVVYTNYCCYTVGQGRLIFDEADPKMSSTQFVKLCCDLGVLKPAGPLTVVAIDLIFYKCKPQGGNRFRYPDFLKAMDAIEAESELFVADLIYIIGAQIKPSPFFFAPKPITSQPKERYKSRKRLQPTIAWGRSSSDHGPMTVHGPSAMSSSMQDLRKAIEEAEGRKNSVLESLVYNQGVVLSNKAELLETLVMSLHEQLQDLKDENASLGTEMQHLKEFMPKGESAGVQEIQNLQAALLVALKSVGVESLEAVEEPSMLTVACAYHNKTLYNDSMIAQLADRVASLEASGQEHSQKFEDSCQAMTEQMSGMGQQLCKLEEQGRQQCTAISHATEQVSGMGQQLCKLEEQSSQQQQAVAQQRAVASQAAEQLSKFGQQLCKLEERGSQQHKVANQTAERVWGLGKQVGKLEEQSSQQQQAVAQQRDFVDVATEQLSGLRQQVGKLEEQNSQQQQEAAQQREVANQEAEQIAALGQQLAKLGEQGSQQQHEMVQQLAASQQDLAAQLLAVQESCDAKVAALEQAQAEQREVSTLLQAVQQDGLAKVAGEVEKWQQEGSAKLAELEKWQQEGTTKLAELERWHVEQQEEAARQLAAVQEELAKQQDASILAKLEAEHVQQQEQWGLAVQETANQLTELQAQLASVQQEQVEQQESSKAMQEATKQLAELQAQLSAGQQTLAEQQEKSSLVQAAANQLAELQAQLAAVQQAQAEQQRESSSQFGEVHRQLAEQQAYQESSQAAQQQADQLLQSLQQQQQQQEQQQDILQQLQELGRQLAELESRLAEQERLPEGAVREPHDVHASLRPGLEAVAAMLEVLGRGPCDAQRRMGMATAAAALQAMAEAPESASSHPDFSEAVGAVRQSNKDPSDQAYREGLKAAATAIAAVVKNADTGAHSTDLSAAAGALQSASEVPWNGDCRPGVMAGALGLQAMADDPKQASHEPGIRAAISILHALGCNPGNPDQRQGIAAASTALETMSSMPVLPRHGPGLAAASVSLDALSHAAQQADISQNKSAAAGSEDAGMQGALRKGVSGAGIAGAGIATAALERQGLVPHGEVHHPGILAAAAALRAYADSPQSKALELSPAEKAKRAYSALRAEAASAALPAIEQQVESLQQQLQQMPALQEQMQEMEQQLQRAQQALGYGLSALGLDEAGLGVPDAAAMPAKQKQDLAAAVRTLEAKDGKEAGLKESLSQAISAVASKLAEVEQEATVLKDTCAHKSELKELENSLLGRMNVQDSGHEQMRLTLDVIVADITKLAMEHGVSMGLDMQKPKDRRFFSSPLQPFTLSTVLRNFMTYSELVERFATMKSLQELGNTERSNAEVARKNEEAILLALKSADHKFTFLSDNMAKVLIRTARQVDYLHNIVREVPGADEPEFAVADLSHPENLAELGQQRPTMAGGAPYSIRDMGALQRSSGMMALLMQRNEAGENAVDIALRSIDENAAGNASVRAQGQDSNDPGLAGGDQHEPRKHISSSAARWGMALKNMKPRQSQEDHIARASAGWDLLHLAAQEGSKAPEPEPPTRGKKQAKAPEGRNKVFVQPRPSRSSAVQPSTSAVPLAKQNARSSTSDVPPTKPDEPASSSSLPLSDEA